MKFLLVAKSCMRSLVGVITSCFAKRCFPKYWFFSHKMSAYAKTKLTLPFGQDFFQPTREWVNNVSLSSFQLKNVFKFVLARLACEKQNVVTSQPCLHTLIQTRLSASQSARTILFVLYIIINNYCTRLSKISWWYDNLQEQELTYLHNHNYVISS